MKTDTVKVVLDTNRGRINFQVRNTGDAAENIATARRVFFAHFPDGHVIGWVSVS